MTNKDRHKPELNLNWKGLLWSPLSLWFNIFYNAAFIFGFHTMSRQTHWFSLDCAFLKKNSWQAVYWTSWRREMVNIWSCPSWWTWPHRWDQNTASEYKHRNPLCLLHAQLLFVCVYVVCVKCVFGVCAGLSCISNKTRRAACRQAPSCVYVWECMSQIFSPGE